jgi:hypothetical protein
VTVELPEGAAEAVALPEGREDALGEGVDDGVTGALADAGAEALPEADDEGTAEAGGGAHGRRGRRMRSRGTSRSGLPSPVGDAEPVAVPREVAEAGELPEEEAVGVELAVRVPCAEADEEALGVADADWEARALEEGDAGGAGRRGGREGG